MTSSNGNSFRVTGHFCVNSPHKGQWRGALMFSLICARINGWVNNPEAGDLRRHPTHCDVIVMIWLIDSLNKQLSERWKEIAQCSFDVTVITPMVMLISTINMSYRVVLRPSCIIWSSFPLIARKCITYKNILSLAMTLGNMTETTKLYDVCSN